MNILMGAVSSSQESRFYNGTGHILELAVSNNILDLFAMSLSKIPLKINTTIFTIKGENQQ